MNTESTASDIISRRRTAMARYRAAKRTGDADQIASTRTAALALEDEWNSMSEYEQECAEAADELAMTEGHRLTRRQDGATYTATGEYGHSTQTWND